MTLHELTGTGWINSGVPNRRRLFVERAQECRTARRRKVKRLRRRWKDRETSGVEGTVAEVWTNAVVGQTHEGRNEWLIEWMIKKWMMKVERETEREREKEREKGRARG